MKESKETDRQGREEERRENPMARYAFSRLPLFLHYLLLAFTVFHPSLPFLSHKGFTTNQEGKRQLWTHPTDDKDIWKRWSDGILLAVAGDKEEKYKEK